MTEHQHYVSGFFATRDEALETCAILMDRELQPAQIQLYETNLPAAAPKGKEGWLDSLVRDAIASGQIVLVVDTRTAEQTKTAKEVIRSSVGDYQDVAAT